MHQVCSLIRMKRGTSSPLCWRQHHQAQGKIQWASTAANIEQGMQDEVYDYLPRPDMGCKRARKLIIPEQRVIGALLSRHTLPAGFQVDWTPWHLLYEADQVHDIFAW